LSEAAAEELRVPVGRIQLVMADTGLVPDDGVTAGSGSTPRTVPAVRHGAAAAREVLVGFAAKRWGVERSMVQVQDGKATRTSSQDSLSYADLAADADAAKALDQAVPSDVALTAVAEWKVLGQPTPRPNARDLVTGAHQYPSDISRPGMLYGKVLRPPSYGAKLAAVDLAPAQAMKDVVAVRDDQFVGVAAPTTFLAEKALDASAKTAKWEPTPHPSSKDLFDYLKQHVPDGLPTNPFADELTQAKKVLRQTYEVAYVQHAPLEPRAAVAEWIEGKLTVWTGTQNPFGCRSELARAFHLGEDQVRVMVPDFGSGFGGKHTGEAGIEAARLAKAAGRPVSLRWTRREEFTWAYFRPAAVIQIEGGLDDKGTLTSWHFVNIPGTSSISMPAVPALKPLTAPASARASLCGRNRHYVKALTVAWPPPAITLPANPSWMSWPPLPAWTRSNSGWPTSTTRACAPCLKLPRSGSAGRSESRRRTPNWASASPAAPRRARLWRRAQKLRLIALRSKSPCGACARSSSAGPF
jgi:isoquinoline 1-oxidoreductase